MGVAVLLMGLLMPALSQVRENAHRIMCASNQRQIGLGLFTYAAAEDEKLPFASSLHMPQGEQPRPDNLMSVRGLGNSSENPNGWDGIGILFFRDYCGAGQCFYCPSHHGSHPYERYNEKWNRDIGPVTIFSNFHYCGDVDWVTGNKRSLHEASSNMVLLTDGLRTADDFNHNTGMNVLRGDGSVIWRDSADDVYDRLPTNEDATVMLDTDYHTLWNTEIELD